MTTVCKILTFIFLYFWWPGISNAQKSNIAFRHLTTKDGLSQSNIYAILQDRQGFMWFATRDGLNRYDGNTFVVYKHNPADSESLSGNYIFDLIEDDNGYLWITCNGGGVNKFDPTTGRFTRYLHDPDNPNSISGNSIESVVQDSHGYLWFGTAFSGLDKFDPATQTFTHYRNDIDGQFVGRITNIIEDSHGGIWFVGNRGLFHLNPQTGQITRPPATVGQFSADYICEDKAGNLWMLAISPKALIKYDPQTERLFKYPNDAIGSLASFNLLDDGRNGFWVPTRQGLFHFDRKTERFTHLFQHDETDPDGLNDDYIISIFQDRGGLLWLGTEKGGLNILNFQQEQFRYYRHNTAALHSLSPGRVTAIHEDPDGILWVGFNPRILDRFDRSSDRITHYIPDPKNENTISKGLDINCIHKDTRGYVWLSGWEGGLDRFDKRNGQIKHFRHNPDDPNSLISNNVLYVYEDRSGHLWLGQNGGLSCFDPATEQFTNYRHNPDDPTSLGFTNVSIIYQDHSGALWLGTWEGILSCFDNKTKTFLTYTPDSRDPHKLYGGSIYAIHEDRDGTLWLGASDGLYRFNRKNELFTRYTESQGLPSSSIMGILEDNVGRLWLSTKNGLSRFNPQTETFRNYGASDGIQDNDFSERCYEQGPNGEMFFGSSKGFHAFFPDRIRDNPYIPPIVLTDFRLFGKSVPIGNGSVLKSTINNTDTLILPYYLNNLSFEFAALSYAAPEKNRYRYKLEGFDADWHNVGSKERLAVYTNLKAGNYVFRVQGSNQDGVWNKKGKTIYIKIHTPWWQTWWFLSIFIAALLTLAFAIHYLRVMNIKKFNLKLQHEVTERTWELDAANEELWATNEELATANENFQTVNTKLETVNKELEAFSYSVSHDLRAPLRGIDGFSQILLEDYQDKVDEQGKNYLQRIRLGTQRMAQLIDDMLNLSRISQSEKKIQQVYLSEMVKEIAENFHEAQPERHVEFIIQEGIKLQADNQLLRIVLENLIGNAWKYTSKHPTARIEFGVQQQNENAVYFVRDDGAGFDMNNAEKLFGAFQRLHTVTEFAGTGIGLATVQRVIHRHGGKVWAEGEVEKGATFYFTIP